MKNKKELIIQLHAVLGSLGIRDKELKQDMVQDATGGRATSSKDMTEQELETLIRSLNDSKPGSAAQYGKQNLLRRRIISKFREMGYNIYSDADAKMVADMDRIEQMVEAKWSAKLNDLSTDKLTKIIGVLEKEWLPNYYKNKKTND